MSTTEQKKTHHHHHHHHHRHRYSKEERRRMSTRRLVSLLLAFVLGNALFCVVFFAEQSVGWQSNRLMYRTVIGDGYAYRNVELLKARLEELLKNASLPSQRIMDDFFDEDGIYRTYSKNIQIALMEGEQVEMDSIAFGESFGNAVQKELSDEGITVNEQVQSRISELGHQASESYNELLSVSYMNKFYEMSKGFIDRAKIVAIIALFIAIAAAIVLLKMYSYKHHGLHYTASGLLYSIVVNVSAVAVLSRNGWITQVGIGPASYREMLSAFYKKAMEFGILVMLIQIAALIAVIILAQKAKRKG